MQVWHLALLLVPAIAFPDEARYVGSNTCAGCHASIYQSFRRTAMGRSLVPAADPSQVQLAPEPVTVTHPRFPRTLRVWREGGALYQSEAQAGVFETKYRLEYAIGSGVNGYTYLVKRGEHLFQAPLSYYSRVGKWDLSPGYESGDYAFSRPVAEGCLVCHSGRARPVVGQPGRYESPPFAEAAIGCENCHGPGSLHAARRGPIVNPARLAPRLAEQICMFCHQGGDTRVLQPGKRYQDFRPGSWLNETLAIGNLAATQRDADLLEHHNAMQASRCFRASAGKLSCLTCHNPHIEPKQKAEYYRTRCRGCHTRASCSAAPAQRRAQADDCAACHMPKRGDAVISHAALTNHRIVRRPDAPAPAPQPAREGIIYVNAELGNQPLAPVTLLHMYGELIAREPGLQERYLALLEKVAAGDPKDPLVLAALGRREVRENDPAATARAVEHLSGAIERGFTGSAAFEDLAEALSRTGRVAEAVTVLERGLVFEPFAQVLYKSLALRYIALQSYDQARATMKRYVELFPEDDFMRGLLVQLGVQP